MYSNLTVHKTTVRVLRKALVNFLCEQDKVAETPKIMKGFQDLDSHKGNRVSIKSVDKEFAQVATFMQDDFLGLKVSKYIDVTSLRIYRGIQIALKEMTSDMPVITIIFRILTYYMGVTSETINVKLMERKDGVELRICSNLISVANKHHMDIAVYTIHRTLKEFTGLNASKIIISYRDELEHSEMYRRVVGVPVYFSGKHTSLYYSQENILESNNAISLEESLGKKFDVFFLISYLHSMLLEDFEELSYQEQCKKILITTLGISEPTKDNVAKVLNMSVSSLQRRLKKEDVTFHHILRDIRKELAHQYLIDHRLPATHIAPLLGYSASSQFFTAFKSWYSLTPKKYQLSHQSNEL